MVKQDIMDNTLEKNINNNYELNSNINKYKIFINLKTELNNEKLPLEYIGHKSRKKK